MNNIVKFNKNIVKLLFLAMTVATVGMLKPQTVNAEVAAVTVRLTPSATGGVDKFYPIYSMLSHHLAEAM